MQTRTLTTNLAPQSSRLFNVTPVRRYSSTNKMSLFFPRIASFGPTRHEVRPFFDLFNDTFNELQRISDNASARAMWAPKFDLKEEKDKYILEGELPGIEQKNITIDVSDEQTLTIKGHTEYRREEGQRPTEATEVENGEASVDGKTSDSKEVAT